MPDALSTRRATAAATTPSRCAAVSRDAASRSASNGFDHFWSRYPNKYNRGQARAVWEHLDPTPAQQEALLGALTFELSARARHGGRTIAVPIAAVWLLEHQHLVGVETVTTTAARTRRSAWQPRCPPGHASGARRLVERAAQTAFVIAFPVTLAAMLVHGWTAP